MRSLRAVALWVVLLTALVRLPGFVFRILGIDDADFTVIARAITAGAVPYRDVVDIKPPLAFVCYLPNALWGGALWPVQVEGATFVVATALLLGLAAQRTWGSPRAGALAAVLAVLAGVCEAPTVSTELLMNLPVAAALALFARAEHEGKRADDLGAGLLLGLATLVRHQAVFTLGALGLAVLVFGRRPLPGRGLLPGLRVVRAALLAVGTAIPWVVVLAVFHALGALPELVDWVILRNLRYVGQSAGSPTLRLVQALLVCVVCGAPLAWVTALQGLRGVVGEARAPGAFATPGARLRAAWALLLVVTWVPVSLGGRYYEHYFLQFVPPLAVLGAGPLEAMLARAPAWSRLQRAVFAVVAGLPALGMLGYTTARGLLGRYPLQDPRVRQIGAWARANTAPDARLFVWGHYSPIYLAAGRLPGTRYLTTSWQLGNFDPQHLDGTVDLTRFRSDRDVAWTLEDLARRRPEWIVDTTPADIHAWHRMPLSLLPDLEAAIDAGWEPVAAAPGGARILERRPVAVSGP